MLVWIVGFNIATVILLFRRGNNELVDRSVASAM